MFLLGGRIQPERDGNMRSCMKVVMNDVLRELPRHTFFLLREGPREVSYILD